MDDTDLDQFSAIIFAGLLIRVNAGDGESSILYSAKENEK